MSNNDFCPECSTILKPKEITGDDDEKSENGLYLVCEDCSYREKTNSFSAFHFSKKEEKTRYLSKNRISDYIFNKALNRTFKLECINNKCPSRGKNNPEIVIITSGDHPEIAYICSVCKHVWGRL